MNVQIFIPCFVDQLYPQTAFNMIKVLEKTGCIVTYNPNQTCCGQPAFNAGFWDAAKDVCKKFIKDFVPEDSFGDDDYIVAPSASCVGFVRNYYSKLLDNSSLHNDVKELSKRIYEFSEFMVKVLQVYNVGAKLEGKATYHDSCSGLRECRIKQEPRKLLANVKGLELAELNDVETCCGFGGTFAVSEEAVSCMMGNDRIADHESNGTEVLTAGDMSCLMHLAGLLKRQKKPMKVMHVAEILAGDKPN